MKFSVCDRCYTHIQNKNINLFDRNLIAEWSDKTYFHIIPTISLFQDCGFTYDFCYHCYY